MVTCNIDQLACLQLYMIIPYRLLKRSPLNNFISWSTCVVSPFLNSPSLNSHLLCWHRNECRVCFPLHVYGHITLRHLPTCFLINRSMRGLSASTFRCFIFILYTRMLVSTLWRNVKIDCDDHGQKKYKSITLFETADY